MWDEPSCTVVWTFFGIALLWDWNKNWPFPLSIRSSKFSHICTVAEYPSFQTLTLHLMLMKQKLFWKQNIVPRRMFLLSFSIAMILPSMVPRPAAFTSPANPLEVWILRPDTRTLRYSTELSDQKLRVEPSNLTSPPGDSKMFQFENRRRRWHPTPVLLLGKSQGQRSLVGCSPWGC